MTRREVCGAKRDRKILALGPHRGMQGRAPRGRERQRPQSGRKKLGTWLVVTGTSPQVSHAQARWDKLFAYADAFCKYLIGASGVAGEPLSVTSSNPPLARRNDLKPTNRFSA